MNILLVTSFFPPTHTAGTEKRTFGYAKVLLERGHTVRVLCVGNWEKGEKYWNGFTDEEYQGIPVRRVHLNWLKSPDPNGYLFDNPETAAFFLHCVAEWQPDIVHITSCLTLSASIIPAAKGAGLPVLLTLTDFWFVCHRLSLLRYDDSLCDGRTTVDECVRCLNADAGFFKAMSRFSSDAVATRIVQRLSEIPSISRLRGMRGTALDIGKRKAFLSEALTMVDCAVAPSNHLRETLQKSGVKRDIEVIQSGHDLSWLTEPVFGGLHHPLRFGYIGQFIQTKGVHVLLSAFGQRDWNGKAELHLYGGHEENETYWQELQKIEMASPGSIHFHGAFPHSQLGVVLSGLDVLVVPSLWHENNPRVIQEAFASKTPVIASDVGGIAEYITSGVNGFLFERNNSKYLCDILEQIIEKPEQLESVRNRIMPVKTIQDELDDIEKIYHHLVNKQEVSTHE